MQLFRTFNKSVAPKKGFTLAEIIVVVGVAGLMFSLFVVLYRYMFLKQTISSEMMESIRDIVTAVNYLKTDLNSALLAPGVAAADGVGNQKSQSTVEEALAASIIPGAAEPGNGKKFGLIVSAGSSTNRVEYEIDSANVFKRTVYDENNNIIPGPPLSRGKVVGAALDYKLFKENDGNTVYMSLKIKVQTKTISQSGLVPVTKEFAFNIFPYILNNTIKNTEFKK